MSRQSAYQLRARLRGEPFDLAWDAAFRTAYDALAEAAMERALNGVEVPHFHKGELVHCSRRFDERLTVALLAMRPTVRRPVHPSWHPASEYDRGDFPALLHRVAHGPDTWLAEDSAAPEPMFAEPSPPAIAPPQPEAVEAGSAMAEAQPPSSEPNIQDLADWRRYRDEN